VTLKRGASCWVALAASLLAACGGAQQDEGTTPTEDAAAFEEAAGAEEPGPEAGEAVDPGSEVPDGGVCSLPPTAPGPWQQSAVFRRWLRDQSVGRHITVEGFEPRCGDRGGFLVVRLVLRGASGELLSLGRALEAYYPGSSWRALGHDRLSGPGVVLRLRTEVEIPAGATPRPRCTWDPALDC
jgi:hypothetical protein